MAVLFFVFFLNIVSIFCYNEILPNISREELRNDMMANIVQDNLNPNGWNNILCVGKLSNQFYTKINENYIPFTFTITNTEEDFEFDYVDKYSSHTIIIDCLNYETFEEHVLKAVDSPYWHPHSKIILLYHSPSEDIEIAKMFYFFWYLKACNVIIVQYDDENEFLLVSLYSPFVSEKYKLQNNFGCWTMKKVTIPVASYDEDLYCEDRCQNVTLHSTQRANYFGTCMGFDTHKIKFGDTELLRNLDLFEDKSKNFHGFPLRAYAYEVLPFFEIKDNNNGSYSMLSREGFLWTTMAELMNFTIDLTPSKSFMKKPFNFENAIQDIFSFSYRKTDLILVPMYLFDLVIVNVDQSFPYQLGGVCFLSQRADFETILLDEKFLMKNIPYVIKYLVCCFCIWLTFLLFNVVENKTINLDQAGRALTDSVRNILSLSLHKPLKRQSFKIFFTFTVWSFFVINFATQAAVVSFFSAFKRGKEVETYQDIVDKGYVIEGMASPDVVLPEDNELFRIINSRLVPIQDLFQCVNSLSNNSHKICLIDCAVGRYLERNKLNSKGEQYLHIARDKVHSHYMTSMLHKNSFMTNRFNRYMMFIVESGIIRKWEQYRYNEIKEDARVKAIGMEDLIAIFKCCIGLVVLSCLVLIMEFVVYYLIKIKRYMLGIFLYYMVKLRQWKKDRVKRKIQHWKKFIEVSDVHTQTV